MFLKLFKKGNILIWPIQDLKVQNYTRDIKNLGNRTKPESRYIEFLKDVFLKSKTVASVYS